MAVCAGSAAFPGGLTLEGEYTYIYPPEWGPMPEEQCQYMLMNPQEYAQMSVANESSGVILPLALVVIFVLGWIAGAQR